MLTTLSERLPSVRSVTFQLIGEGGGSNQRNNGNSMCDEAKYSESIHTAWPHLRMLDGRKIVSTPELKKKEVKMWSELEEGLEAMEKQMKKWEQEEEEKKKKKEKEETKVSDSASGSLSVPAIPSWFTSSDLSYPTLSPASIAYEIQTKLSSLESVVKEYRKINEECDEIEREMERKYGSAYGAGGGKEEATAGGGGGGGADEEEDGKGSRRKDAGTDKSKDVNVPSSGPSKVINAGRRAGTIRR